jgi:hypothetical protein
VAKEYKRSAFYRATSLAAISTATYGAFEIGKSYGFVMILILIACNVWFGLLVLRHKIVITDDYIVVDIGRLGKRIEYNWDQIFRVSRVRFSFLWMYRVHCKNKPTLMFSNAIADYKDLLREIVERSPNAIVDDSVRKLLEFK